MPPSVTLPAAERHDELIDTALYKLVGGARVGAAGTCWERARKQARLPVKMGGMGLTSAVDIREPAWIGTWALVAGPIVGVTMSDTIAGAALLRRPAVYTPQAHP